MIATNVNRHNKTRKNKKVKAGPCIFPFKYKWKTHTKCYPEADGDICATEINPDTRTLTRYGYCNNTDSKKSSSKDRKETIKKKLRHSSSNNSSTKSKSKSKSSIDKMEPDKEKQETPIPSLNKKIVDALGELNRLMMQQGEPFRARAYQRAQQEIYKYREPITKIDQIRDLPNIGATILKKLEELEQTGKIDAIAREQQKIVEQEKLPINIFSKIYGVGPKRAQQLVDRGITTISQLKLPENMKLLNDKQKIGLNYYYDILERIPRPEIEEFKQLLETIFRDVTKRTEGESTFEIVGSYRRQAETSGDIDLIITDSNDNRDIFRLFLDRLIKDNIIIEVLSRGQTKSLTIGRLPTGSSTDPPRLARRIDLLYSPPKEFPFAILYFTGSQEFNTVMRQRANDQGYTLNEHGISYKSQGVKGELINQDETIKTERDIFDFFNMEYKTPVERRDGYAVIEQEQQEQRQEQKKSNRHSQTQKRSPEERFDKSPDKRITQLELFLKNGISILETFTEAELIEILHYADQEYYCNTNPVLSDDEYDVLREYIVKKYPDNEEADAGHEKCEITKNRVTLPYEMWSMDKIKPDSNALARYRQKFTGPYVLSCKLDGVSALYTYTISQTNNSRQEQRLYTRGNGRIGTDISHLIPYLKLPSKAIKSKESKGELVIRGELIMKRTTFDARYKANFKNPRNLVAGLVNNRTITEERKQMYRDLDFVAYEVIKPDSLKPSTQMDYLSALNPLIVVQNKTIENLTNELLSELLVEWRREYIYEIDGIICADDKVYPRIPSRNPEHAFAFKMVLSDQTAEARVVDVIWTPSKDGYLKPRVQIEPVTLGGVTITYLTGKNARFIQNRKIGIGAIIRIIRSGDVIPEIEDRDDVVIRPAETPLFPPESEYVWNQTGVDIMLADKTANQTVAVKTIANFFKHLQVDGIGEGIVKRLVAAGFNTIAKVLAMSHADFLKIDGVKDRLATKLTTNIQTQLQAKSFAEIAAATNIFGRGLGQQRIETILEHEPDIFQKQTQTKKQLIDRVKKIPGMAQKTATQFVEHLPEFIEFMKTANLQQQLDLQQNQQQLDQPNQDPDHELYKKKIVMTGFRDKELEARLKQIGAQIKNNITQDTYVVLVKDLEEDTGKANQARENNIPLMLPEEFRIIHNL